MSQRTRGLSVSLLLLAAGLLAVALLGPLVAGVIEYRYSPTMLNQAAGLDGFAVAVVAPLAVLAAFLVARRHRAGPLLALAPSGFALYMSSQYVIGPEYLLLPGNNERAFLLFVGLFVVGAMVLHQAWGLATVPPWPRRMERRRGLVLLGLALFVVVGMYLMNGFVGAMSDFPHYVAERAAVTEYDEHPTAFWLVAFLDLAVVAPLAAATGIALLRRRTWAHRAAYGVLGWFALVPGSVAAMALTMLAREDPAANGAKAMFLTAVAVAFLALAVRLFVPLFRAETWAGAGEAAAGTAGTHPVDGSWDHIQTRRQSQEREAPSLAGGPRAAAP